MKMLAANHELLMQYYTKQLFDIFNIDILLTHVTCFVWNSHSLFQPNGISLEHSVMWSHYVAPPYLHITNQGLHSVVDLVTQQADTLIKAPTS